MWTLTATELLNGYRDGSLSPVEVMQALLARIEVVNPKINALYEVDAEGAMEQARASADRWVAGAPQGPLDGVPVVIKDSIAVRGMTMLRGLKARRDVAPDTEDSPPVARLREAGAILFAKSTMPDMGFLGAGVSSACGVTRNPWDLSLNTGGSSAGSAAAVAAGLVPVAVGSDVGGSVRLPASHCGLVALKPSAGAIPHLPYSRDRSAGPITRTVEDAILMMSVLGQPDERAFEPGATIPEVLAPMDLTGKRIGLMLSVGDGPEVDADVADLIRQAAEVFRGLGAEIIEIENPVGFPFLRALSGYFSVKAAYERAGLPEDRRGDMLEILTTCADRGAAMTALEFAKALGTVEKAQLMLKRAVGGFDMVLSPTMPMANYAAEAVAADPEHPHDHVGFTAPFNQSGQPAATVLCGFSGTSPVGLQLIGSLGQDIDILRACLAYEAARGKLRDFPAEI
ncbi:amidase [Pseudooceanicola sp. CBS1P-1]|uniref:Amidase n=1 Tax=Pseudooceanicola albus TaxID=2692189 RepID=A0A6L7G5P8_9RHOB|nr:MULTISPECIES: amidase [Pseudooceanicola]MBT9385294.1 amidase [Pseudooceanicola endophyticus]MXN18847.1 amidase [Pseudooceanicola albus]